MNLGWAIRGTFDDLLTAIDCEHRYGEWTPCESGQAKRRRCSQCRTTEYWFEPEPEEGQQLELVIEVAGNP